MSPSEPALSLRGVRKVYAAATHPVVAVDGIDVTVAPGEIVAFLGPNGAGKTTTLDMCLGLVPPTAGTIEVFGQDPRAAVVAGRVSAVLQSGGLLRDLTVGETVRAIAALHGVPERAALVMERAGITEHDGGLTREHAEVLAALHAAPVPASVAPDNFHAVIDAAARFLERRSRQTEEGGQ